MRPQASSSAPFEVFGPRGEYIEQLLELVKEALGDKLLSFVVYGSVARGNASKASDIDVLVILKAELPMHERASLLAKAISKLKSSEAARRLSQACYCTHVDVYPLTAEEAKAFRMIYLDMVDDAVILHDTDGFFAGILSRVRKKLAELGSVKVRFRDGWYWVLKPDIRFGDEVRLELQ